MSRAKKFAVMAVLAGALTAGAVSVTGAPAFAQATLSATQLSDLQTSLTTALKATTSEGGSAQTAVAQVLINAIAQYKGASAYDVASALLSLCQQAGVSATDCGEGLGQGAVQLASTDSSAASSVATAVRDAGNQEEILAFEDAANGSGHNELASIAGGSASPTGTISGGGGLAGGGIGATFSGAFTSGGGGAGGGGCLNPSCTKL